MAHTGFKPKGIEMREYGNGERERMERGEKELEQRKERKKERKIELYKRAACISISKQTDISN